MEKVFENILLATDDREESLVAIQRTCDIALKFESKITALFLDNTADSPFEDSIVFLKGYCSSKGIALQIIEKTGDLNSETIKQLSKEDYSLAVLGFAKTTANRIGRSSPLYKTIKAANCPTISSNGTRDAAGINHILLPLADSPTTRQKVPYCAALATAFGATVHIYGVSKSNTKGTRESIESYIRQTERYLIERRIKYSVDLRLGTNVPDALLAYGKKVGADLVITMTDTENAGFLKKTYAEQLVAKATVPTMCVHSRDASQVVSVRH